MARPKGVHTIQLTAEQRQRVRTLYYDTRLSYNEIKKITNYSKSQIVKACNADTSTPKPRSGRPRSLTPKQEEELVEFVCSSKKNRRMSFLGLSMVLFNAVFGLYVIRSTLRRLGFSRRIARQKPFLSEETQRKRRAWAEIHRHWTVEQWAKILWTDETWITGGHHRRQWVTRRKDEAWDDTCIVERHQRKGGWMFWGSFSGATGKGPGIFWEKDWGMITSETYQAHTVPIIDGWIRQCRQNDDEELIFMQDNAPAHKAAATIQDMKDRNIRLLDWPPYSPDMNPIETVWNWMKDYIEDKYGLEEKPSYDRLRAYVLEAWAAVPETWLLELVASMPERCEDLYKANGGHTKH